MESYWPSLVKNPSGNKPMDEFAVLIDNISKIVFSRTLKNVDWKNTTLKKEIIKKEVLELKHQAGKNILVGSPSLIVALTQLDLIDEYQLCVHPIILGSGLPLFKNVKDRINLKLLKTKTFGSENRDPRVEAELEAIITRFEDLGLIQDVGYKRNTFRLTADGYKTADKLIKSAPTMPNGHVEKANF